MKRKWGVTVLPVGRVLNGEGEENLYHLLNSAGIITGGDCGGEGICGRCAVKVVEGEFSSRPSPFISAEERGKGWVLACLTGVRGDTRIEVPETGEPDLEEDPFSRRLREDFLRTPFIRRWRVERIPSLILPDRGGAAASSLLLRQAERMGVKGDLTLSSLRGLDRLVKGEIEDRGKGLFFSILNDREKGMIFRVDGDDFEEYGLAIDVGTTMVELLLCGLRDGRVLARDLLLNGQIPFGEDVVKRIIFSRGEGGLERLKGAIAKTLDRGVERVAAMAGIRKDSMVAASISGNTTMLHLLLGIPPDSILKEPYNGLFGSLPSLSASQAGIRINPEARVFVMPCISGFIGGDVVSGVASLLPLFDGNTLFLDMGTNGEIVLGDGEWLLACSCSAGPAFEGRGISGGMRAARGAISSVEISKGGEGIDLGVIGGGRPAGICGSGMIDLLYELRKAGSIDGKGRFTAPGSRIGREGLFVIARGIETLHGREIMIRERDIANIRRAKAAVSAGIEFLLERADMDPADVARFFVSGGFGRDLNTGKAKGIGLFPPLPDERFTFSGNTSLSGALFSLLSEEFQERCRDLAGMITPVSLMEDPLFNEKFMEKNFIPGIPRS